MSGPSVTRSDVNTAPMAGLTPDVESFLKSLLQNPSRTNGLLSQFNTPTSALQGQIGNNFQNLLSQPTAQSRTLDQARQMLGGIFNQNPGQSVVDAANPIFQRNLNADLSRSAELGGRFSTANQRIAGDLSQKALGDFNLFTQQALQQGQQTQLQGFDLLGRLSSGADSSVLNNLTGAGGFDLANRGLQQQGNNAQMQFLSQLLGQAFGAGGAGSGPALVNNPGTFAQLMSGLGAGANLFAGLGGTAGLSRLFGGGGTGTPNTANQDPTWGWQLPGTGTPNLGIRGG